MNSALATALLMSAAAASTGSDALVDAGAVVPGLVLELRYATDDNFLHRAVYPRDARCLLRQKVALRLGEVARDLAAQKLRLKVYDCYRPLSVQEEMWRAFPHEGYVANPAKGSMHNRGGAVDVTLVREDGTPLPMPTAFDDFTAAAHHDSRACSREAQANRALLREAMQRRGFRLNPKEWWHYSAPESLSYPLTDEKARKGDRLLFPPRV